MSTPLSADRFVQILRDEGLNVVENPGWRTHNRNHMGAWGDVNGVVIHHTAGTNSLRLCINGTSGLPGPLCHAHLAKDGTLTLIGNGRTNHAGTFAQNAFNAVVNESTGHPRPDTYEPIDGNRHFYGIEVENRGDGDDPYPKVQYDAAVKFAAAICRAHGWTANSVIGHKEGTRRKIDPVYSMYDFRDAVARQLASRPEPVAVKKTPAKKPVVDLSRLAQAARTDPRAAQGRQTYAAGTRLVEKALQKVGMLSSRWASDGSFGSKTVGAYAEWQRSLGYQGGDADGIPGKASLTKLGQKTGLFTVKE